MASRWILGSLLALGLAGGCATTGSATRAAIGAATKAAVNEVAKKAGVSPAVATVAVGAAQEALAGAPVKDDAAKAAAAQKGVEAATHEAESAGKPLGKTQKVALEDSLRGVL